MMKDRIIKSLKIYAVFFLFALLINLTMEIVMKIIVNIPESLDISGIIIFFSIFSFFGALIFIFKSYRPKKMGLCSLVLGFVLEFSFMKPDWVQNIYALKIGGDVIVAIIVTSFYWFIAWGIPSYVIHKYLIKSGAP